MRWGRRKPMGPTGLFVTAAVIAAFGLFLITVAITYHREANRSALVQQHGVRTDVVVTSTVQSTHHSRSRTWHTCAIHGLSFVPSRHLIALAYPGPCWLSGGQTVSALQDPDDPFYGEIPGRPWKRTSDWVSLAAIDTVFLLIAAGMVWRGVQLRRVREGRAAARNLVS